MRSSVKVFFKNFSYTFFANFLSMGISVLTILLIPRVVGETSYGYVQLYTFYVGYTSYLSFGVSDGLYIRYGGKKIETLNKSLISSQYWILNIIIMILTIAVIILICFCGNDYNKNILIIWAMVSALIIVPRSAVLFSLLATNNIKDNSFVIILERTMYFVFVCVLLLLNVTEFIYYVYSDLLSKLISTIYLAIRCKELFKVRAYGIKIFFIEFVNNIKVGIKIVIAGIAGMLIIGIIRLAVSDVWSIEVFGKVSLSLSLANMIMIFINAVAVVIFPWICNNSIKILRDTYVTIDKLLQLSLLIIMTIYYPIKFVLCQWLPQYIDGINYMALLFPICLFECKTSLLLNTYLKALRKESVILKCNFLASIISLAFTIVTIYWLQNLTLAVLSVTLSLAARCVLLENATQKALSIRNIRNNVVDILIMAIFIIANWSIGGLIGCIVYLGFAVVIFFVNKKEFYYFKRYYKKIK